MMKQDTIINAKFLKNQKGRMLLTVGRYSIRLPRWWVCRISSGLLDSCTVLSLSVCSHRCKRRNSYYMGIVSIFKKTERQRKI